MASKRKKAGAKAGPMVYVGPTLPNGLLARFTVFSGGEFVPHVKELADKSPALRGLIVPVSQLNQARKDVTTQGHILHLHAKNVLKEITQ